jgi:hypothetical protein
MNLGKSAIFEGFIYINMLFLLLCGFLQKEGSGFMQSIYTLVQQDDKIHIILSEQRTF